MFIFVDEHIKKDKHKKPFSEKLWLIRLFKKIILDRAYTTSRNVIELYDFYIYYEEKKSHVYRIIGKRNIIGSTYLKNLYFSIKISKNSHLIRYGGVHNFHMTFDRIDEILNITEYDLKHPYKCLKIEMDPYVQSLRKNVMFFNVIDRYNKNIEKENRRKKRRVNIYEEHDKFRRKKEIERAEERKKGKNKNK